MNIEETKARARANIREFMGGRKEMNTEEAKERVHEFLHSMSSHVQETMRNGIEKYGMAYLLSTSMLTAELLKKSFIDIQELTATPSFASSPFYEESKKFFEQQLFKLDIIQELSGELIKSNLSHAINSFIENGS